MSSQPAPANPDDVLVQVAALDARMRAALVRVRRASQVAASAQDEADRCDREIATLLAPWRAQPGPEIEQPQQEAA